MSASRLPPPHGVFSITTSIEINATPDNVFGILTDFPSYHIWNPYMAYIYPIDETTSAERPFSQDTLKPGTLLEVKARMDLSKPDTLTPSRIRIASVKPGEVSEVNWNGDVVGVMARMFSAERKQLVWRREDGMTVYETQECFSGVVAYIVKAFFKNSIGKGLKAVAKGLKEYAEKKGAHADTVASS